MYFKVTQNDLSVLRSRTLVNKFSMQSLKNQVFNLQYITSQNKIYTYSNQPNSVVNTLSYRLSKKEMC